MSLFDSQCYFLASVFLALWFSLETVNAGDMDVPSSAKTASSTIQWRDLAPENGRPFNDPFSKLSKDQLADLSQLRHIRRLIREEKIAVDGVDAKEAATLTQKLAAQGIDANWLLIQTRRIPQLRRQQIESAAKSVSESIDSKTVEIVGFASPIPGKKRVGFLVMPTAAMCGHSTPPSPLHVAFVKTEKHYALQSRGTPVRIRGKVIAESKATTMMSGSGATDFTSAYTIIPTKIDVLTPARGNARVTPQKKQTLQLKKHVKE